MASPTERFDVVVAGAGHNSLITAAYLSRAGFRCLVLEGRESPGGDANSEELTLPGFIHDTCSTAHNLLQASPTIRDNELHLDEYGLEYIKPDPVVHVPFPDGTWLTQWHDPERTSEEFAKFSKRDADAYREVLHAYEEVAPAYTTYRYTPAGWGPSLGEALASAPNGRKWLRRQAMSAWEIIRDLFEDDHTRAFMLWMALMTVQPVDRPGTGLLAYSLVFGRQRHSWTMPRGGSSALPTALVRLIEAHGGTVLTRKRVVGLILEDGRCVGVETESGEQFRAERAVLSTIHVKHLVDMAPPAAWGEDFLYGVQTWSAGLSMFVTHYATTAPVVFGVEDGSTIAPVAAGMPMSVERILRVGTDFRDGRVVTDEPVLLVMCPTVADPSRAPQGKHTVKLLGFQPYELPEGPDRWDEIKEEVSEANLAHLRRYSSSLSEESILARVVKSPLDLERFNPHNWHGSCHGGDMGPAQSGGLRPAPGWAEHRMPIPGLYQTGATTHPGGSVSAAPGRNAAMVMLEDLGTSLGEVIGNA